MFSCWIVFESLSVAQLAKNPSWDKSHPVVGVQVGLLYKNQIVVGVTLATPRLPPNSTLFVSLHVEITLEF